MKKNVFTLFVMIAMLGVIFISSWFLFGEENMPRTFKASVISEDKVKAKIINLHSHPQQGENWIISFETEGVADLKVIPVDESTIEDDEFVALYCGNEERRPEVLEKDVIFYKEWKCSEKSQIVHYTKKAGKHIFRFEFGDEVMHAYNSAAWYHPNWTKRKKITIDSANVDSDLTDFPLYVDITADTDIGANAQSDGDDIRFTKDDGVTGIPYEKEGFSVTDGSATGHFWVKVPMVNGSANTDIYVYYGNPLAADGQQAKKVWSNYDMIYHLSALGNSTEKTGLATAFGDAVAAAAKIANGYTFDGSGDYLTIGDDADISLPDANWAIGMWIKISSNAGTGYQYFLSWAALSANPSLNLYLGEASCDTLGDRNLLKSVAGDGDVTDVILNSSTTPGASTEWQHIALQRSGTTVTYYVNGSSVASAASATFDGVDVNGSLYLSGRSDLDVSRFFDGDIDEFRKRNSVPSAAELKFEIANINEADNEIEFAAQETYTQPSYLRYDGGTKFR